MARTVTDIDVRTESIPINSLGHHVGDPKWVSIDSHGHEHRFDGDDLFTLEWVVTGEYWCEDCRDMHEEGEYRCRQCADVVEPHWNHTGPISGSIPGLTDVTIKATDWRGNEDTYYLRGDEADGLLAAKTKSERDERAQAIIEARPPDAQTFDGSRA